MEGGGEIDQLDGGHEEEGGGQQGARVRPAGKGGHEANSQNGDEDGEPVAEGPGIGSGNNQVVGGAGGGEGGGVGETAGPGGGIEASAGVRTETGIEGKESQPAQGEEGGEAGGPAPAEAAIA